MIRRHPGVAAIAAAVVLSGCTSSSHTAHPQPRVQPPQIRLVTASGLTCPAHSRGVADPQVPTAPPMADRLAPVEAPTQILLCRYRYTHASWTLQATRDVHRGLASAGAQLTWLPRYVGSEQTCTAIGGRHTPYLVGLQYATGVLWLSTAYDVNSCVQTSNGTFTSSSYIGHDVDHAFTTGTWKAGYLAQNTGCLAWPVGRLGQEHQLVPADPTALTLCSADAAPGAPPARVRVTRDFSALVRALNGVATAPTGNACDPRGDEPVTYEARFDYAGGPAVVVDVRKNCYPLLSNGSLDGVGSARIWALTDDLARHPGTSG